jgi:hypothetical protein
MKDTFHDDVEDARNKEEMISKVMSVSRRVWS